MTKFGQSKSNVGVLDPSEGLAHPPGMYHTFSVCTDFFDIARPHGSVVNQCLSYGFTGPRQHGSHGPKAGEPIRLHTERIKSRIVAQP